MNEHFEDFKAKAKVWGIKLKHRLSIYKMSNLMDEISLLGYEISGRNIAFVVLLIAFLNFIVGYLLRLKMQYILILLLIFILCMPGMLIMKFRHDFQMKRFSDIVGYMEQMIYAFHKNGKIRSSLVDVHEVSKGTIKQFISEMLYIIDYDMTTSNIYEKAFAVLQNEYDCTRLKILHEYLLNVEKNGGKVEVTLDVMLEDIRAWSERIVTYQSDRKNIQIKTLISICCALLSCGIMINLIPLEFTLQIVENSVYQIGTVVILGLNILVFVLSSSRVSISYLDNELDKKLSADLKKQVQYLADWHKKNHFKSSIIKALMLTPVLIAGIYFKYYWAVIMVAGFMIMFLTHDFMYKSTCLKNVTKEIKKVFPIWLRNLILYLETENVHVAVKNSYDTCPAILKPEVENFIDNLSADPVSMRPYLNFLATYQVPELKLAIHYLYSVATFGAGESTNQLDYLIKQNSKLEITEEKIRNDDSLTGFSLMILLPMLLAIFKLMLDLMMFLSIFMGQLQTTGL